MTFGLKNKNYASIHSLTPEGQEGYPSQERESAKIVDNPSVWVEEPSLLQDYLRLQPILFKIS